MPCKGVNVVGARCAYEHPLPLMQFQSLQGTAMNATNLVTLAGKPKLLDRVHHSADNPPRRGGAGSVVGRLGPTEHLKSCCLVPLPPDAGRGVG